MNDLSGTRRMSSSGAFLMRWWWVLQRLKMKHVNKRFCKGKLKQQEIFTIFWDLVRSQKIWADLSTNIFHFQCTIDDLSGAAAKARTQHSEGAGGQEMLPWQVGSWSVWGELDCLSNLMIQRQATTTASSMLFSPSANDHRLHKNSQGSQPSS